jgi:hypothetical protein
MFILTLAAFILFVMPNILSIVHAQVVEDDNALKNGAIIGDDGGVKISICHVPNGESDHHSIFIVNSVGWNGHSEHVGDFIITSPADRARCSDTPTPPNTGGSNGNEAGTIIPNTSGSNGNETGPIIPNTGGSNGNETGPIIPSTGGTNGDEGIVVTINPPNNDGGNTSGGSTIVNTSGGSTSSGSSGGFSRIFSPTQGLYTASSTCPLITTYMRLGGDNDGADVARLQSFFKNSESLNVDVSGTFDQKTDQATRDFQSKYQFDILGPWSASQPSGYVYITTSKRVNELACQRPLSLSASDLAIINRYKQQKLASLETNSVQNSQPTPAGAVGASTTPNTIDATSTQEIGVNQPSENTNLAAVGGSSILSRFWNFIVNIFK